MSYMPIFFLAGAQKCGTTWLYQCLKQHPDIFVPKQNMINFFNINYYRGFEWYQQWFKDVSREKAVFDTTMTYMRDNLVPERIYKYNPQAKFVFAMRNPIDRAFSHYWHEKKKGKISFSFEEALFYSGVGNYDLFEDWIKAGFYYTHLKSYLKYFSINQMFFVLLDEIENNPQTVIENLYKFVGVSPNFRPSVLNKKINVAGPRQNKKKLDISGYYRHIPKPFKTAFRKIFNVKSLSNTNEYRHGLSKETRQTLYKIFENENIKLEKLIKKDLKNWL